MDEDLDVDALLDAPFAKENDDRRSSSPVEKSKKSKKKKSRDHSHERESKSSKEDIKRDRKSSKRDRSRSPKDRNRDRREPVDRHTRDRRYSRSPDRRRPIRRGYYPRFERRSFRGGYPNRRPERESYSRRSRSRSPERKSSVTKKSRSPSPPLRRLTKRHDSGEDFSKPKNLGRNPDLTPEERDMRTVFCMQLSQRVRARDLEEFFSPVGKVQDVRIILDNKTKRSKGIAYIEFQETYSVSLAMGYSGKKLLGVPIIVQLTQAEKNRAAMSSMAVQRDIVGPMRLYVGSLHFNITEEMLKGIFEPFGKIDRIELLKDSESGKSKGYGFITA